MIIAGALVLLLVGGVLVAGAVDNGPSTPPCGGGEPGVTVSDVTVTSDDATSFTGLYTVTVAGKVTNEASMAISVGQVSVPLPGGDLAYGSIETTTLMPGASTTFDASGMVDAAAASQPTAPDPGTIDVAWTYDEPCH